MLRLPQRPEELPHLLGVFLGLFENPVMPAALS
jgi:hypothetical protein